MTENQVTSGKVVQLPASERAADQPGAPGHRGGSHTVPETKKAPAKRTTRKPAKKAPATKPAVKKAEPKGPVVITAPTGDKGAARVEVNKPALAKAIKAAGPISTFARKHGQNPSQIRRMAAEDVAHVDKVRAESIAKALGVPFGQVFKARVVVPERVKADATSEHEAAEKVQGTRRPARKITRKVTK
jgi:hypothetical protein